MRPQHGGSNLSPGYVRFSWSVAHCRCRRRSSKFAADSARQQWGNSTFVAGHESFDGRPDPILELEAQATARKRVVARCFLRGPVGAFLPDLGSRSVERGPFFHLSVLVKTSQATNLRQRLVVTVYVRRRKVTSSGNPSASFRPFNSNSSTCWRPWSKHGSLRITSPDVQIEDCPSPRKPHWQKL